MQASTPSPFHRSALCRLALILTVGCALAACDKHSATEVPESYGHGSARQKSYTDHEVDSSGKNPDPKHHSDTQGTVTEKSEQTAAEAPSASPAGTPGGHFF